MSSSIVEELEWRGLLSDISNKEEIMKLPESSVMYGGFDPSAPSLQIGNLVAVLTIARFAKCGFKAIGLFGGATGAIGDPKGEAERSLLAREQVDFNVVSQKRKLTEIYNRLNVDVEFVNNYDWFKDINVLDFLRDIGKYFPVGYMLSKDTVKKRLETIGISYAEFSYMLIQAYDFYYLFQEKNCVLQVGGSDQWGNITSGIEFIRRKLGEGVNALTIPLLTDAQGKKLGKSVNGAIWIDENYLSPYKLHQYLLNMEDSVVIKMLKFLTFLSKEEIDNLERSLKENPENREAQKALADNVVNIVHGEDATKLAKRSAQVLFGGSIEGLNEKDLIDIFSDVPSSTVKKDEIENLTAVDFFVNSNLSSSRGEVKRLIQNGGAYINNEKIENIDIKISDIKTKFSSFIILRSGKKNYHLVKF